MASTRRLAAILAADVASYSRLMGVDEEGTLERLKAHRRRGSQQDGGSRPLLLGHPRFAQAGEISGFEQGSDPWHPPISGY